MSDSADFAADLQDAHLSVSLSRVDGRIPAGVAGECDECGEMMPRLVGGRCGYCRDGRRPPLSRFDSAPVPKTATAVIDPPHEQEETTMPTAKPTTDSRTISVPAKGAVLSAIMQRGADRDLPMGQAAASIIADWIAAPLTRRDAVVVNLDAIRLADLFDELSNRLNSAVTPDLLAAAIARAEAAEGQLAAIQQLLASGGARG